MSYAVHNTDGIDLCACIVTALGQAHDAFTSAYARARLRGLIVQ